MRLNQVGQLTNMESASVDAFYKLGKLNIGKRIEC